VLQRDKRRENCVPARQRKKKLRSSETKEEKTAFQRDRGRENCVPARQRKRKLRSSETREDKAAFQLYRGGENSVPARKRKRKLSIIQSAKDQFVICVHICTFSYYFIILFSPSYFQINRWQLLLISPVSNININNKTF
jgi:hypothetical protein